MFSGLYAAAGAPGCGGTVILESHPCGARMACRLTTASWARNTWCFLATFL